MKKCILKILIVTLILLIGIGAVSAIEFNSTDEFMSVDQTNEISIDNSTETLAVENNDEVISVSENNTDVLSGESDNEVITVSENSTRVLSSESNDSVISVSENNSDVLNAESNSKEISVSNNDLLSYSPFAKDPQFTQSETEYKTFFLGKVKLYKKHLKFANGYKPSKKNKKAWKSYKSYKKSFKKSRKKFKKHAKKVIKNAKRNHWHGDGDVWFNYKKSGKYYVYYFYQDAYRTYKYNPLFNKGWWE